MEEFDYRGWRLQLCHIGATWKVFIYQPGSDLAETETPNSLSPKAQETVLAEARSIVDQKIYGPGNPS